MVDIRKFLEDFSAILVIPKDKVPSGQYVIKTDRTSPIFRISKFSQVGETPMKEDKDTVRVRDAAPRIDLYNIYAKFLETSDLKQVIIESTPEQSIVLQERYPIDMTIVPIIRDGVIMPMLLGDRFSYATCKLMRLRNVGFSSGGRTVRIPDVDFVIENNRVSYIIKSPIAWPLATINATEFEFVMSGSTANTLDFYGYEGTVKIYKDSQGVYWIFPGLDGISRRRVEYPNLKWEAPPEYRLTEIDETVYSIETLKQVLKNNKITNIESKIAEGKELLPNFHMLMQLIGTSVGVSQEYTLSTDTASKIEMLVCLLAMKKYQSIVGQFIDNLTLFGYMRTPLGVYQPNLTKFINSIVDDPSQLYKYQAMRDATDPSAILASETIPFYHLFYRSPILLQIRSYNLNKESIRKQLERKIHMDKANTKIAELEETSESEKKELIEKEFKAPLLGYESKYIDSTLEYKLAQLTDPSHWKPIDWNPIISADQRKITINGTSFNTNEIEYVFQNTSLSSASEAAQDGEEISLPWISSSLIQKLLDGQTPPEDFYNDINDDMFVQLSNSGTFLDYYELPKNREMANTEWVLGERFSNLLSRLVEKRFFSP